MGLRLLAAAALALLPCGAMASDATDRLLDKLGMPALVQIMRDEGLAYSEELGNDMLPGGYSASWGATVARIYDLEAMELAVQQGFANALADVDLAPIEAFFDAPLGVRIVQLELSTRRAMMDPDIETGAKERGRALRLAEDDIYLEVKDFIEAGDLLEANVVGALNANIRFYQGLVTGGAFSMDDAEIISDVWGQEAETRDETRDWLYGFLTMAYMPLEPGELQAYTEFSRTPEGRALTRALFEGFDGMYSDLSFALGLATAQAMKSEDI